MAIRNVQYAACIGTTAAWGSSARVLGSGELGVEVCVDDSIKLKIGDNESLWGALDYVVDQVLTPALLALINNSVQLDEDGLIPLDKIPAAAIAKCVVVADQTARYALTTATVQAGDTVKQTDTDTLYYVVDDTKLTSAAGYETYKASIDWSAVLNKPADIFFKNTDDLDNITDGTSFVKALKQTNANQKFVSVGGSDTNGDGTVARKLRTIFAGLTALAGSGEVDAEAGTYNETLTLGSAHSSKTIRGTKGSNRTIINQTLTLSENCTRFGITDMKFDNVSGYAIDVASTYLNATLLGGNHVFDGLNIGGNFGGTTAIRVRDGGTGFITIANSDLGNKIIQLDNTTAPRYCFLIGVSNAVLNAGTGWIVVKQNCANVIEVSANSNVLEGPIANARINNSTEYAAIAALGNAGNGYYLCNYAESGVFAKGEVILRQNNTSQQRITVVVFKHYNAPNAYTVMGNPVNTAFKLDGGWVLGSEIIKEGDILTGGTP